MFNGSFLRVCRILRFVKKIRFCLLESGRTKPWCPGLVSRPSAKAQEPLARIRGLVIQTQKLSIGAYFELLFLGCGFLIHLSYRSVKNMGHNRNRLYSRAIHCPASTTGTVFIQGPSIILPAQQEPSLFKGHPLSYQYGKALCSMVPS